MNVFKVTLMREPLSGGGYLYRVKDDGTIEGFGNSPKTIDDALKSGWYIYEVDVLGVPYRRYDPGAKPVDYADIKKALEMLSEAIRRVDINEKE